MALIFLLESRSDTFKFDNPSAKTGYCVNKKVQDKKLDNNFLVNLFNLFPPKYLFLKCKNTGVCFVKKILLF